MTKICSINEFKQATTWLWDFQRSSSCPAIVHDPGNYILGITGREVHSIFGVVNLPPEDFNEVAQDGHRARILGHRREDDPRVWFGD